MQSKKVVTIIPKKSEQINHVINTTVKKKRVAGYARVSTELEEQQNSYQSQMDYYTNYIQSRDDWQFVGMYSDEGITGTSIKKREGFSNMINDALEGKIDMIITKSVSRFARNTVDTLSTVRKLKDANVEVYFEKENIYTLDSKGELLLTILSSLAQEESRSISENTTWGQRKRMADGHGCLAFSNFMGYDKGPNGEFVVNQQQAIIVKRIFTDYLDGKSSYTIAKELTDENVKSPAGKDKWYVSTVLSILRNEKYKGDCLMQKYYLNNFLDKKCIKNQGEMQQYYVKNHHEAIISEELFDAVQRKLSINKPVVKESSVRDFSSMLVCGQCGGYYGSKVWHSNSKYKKIIYRCNNKYKGDKCTTPAINEKKLQQLVIKAINKVLINKEEIVENLNLLINIIDKKNYQQPIDEALSNYEAAEEKYRTFIDKQKYSPIPIEQYNNMIKELSDAYENSKQAYSDLLKEKQNSEVRKQVINQYINTIKATGSVVDTYQQSLMKKVLNKIIVNTDKSLVFEFMDGSQILLEGEELL